MKAQSEGRLLHPNLVQNLLCRWLIHCKWTLETDCPRPRFIFVRPEILSRAPVPIHDKAPRFG
jgi:hypothetical protein